MHEQNCIFCKIISGQIPSKIIYQTNHSIILQDIAPQAPIHYLIIPKTHVQDLVSCTDTTLLADLMSIPAILAKQIGEDTAFKLFTNNGYAAGQRVFHLHFHFLSGKTFSE
ncbi:MAG: HIT domain-containing protein [Candidatus Dependentiae bacterium]|nr:HIT domain-containing protein [Candidatus Dependentiae bacterium]